LATRGIDNRGLARAVKRQPLKGGRHRLALEQRQDKRIRRITVAWDETELPTFDEAKERNSGRGSSGGAQYGVSEQLAADEPAVLFRRRFTHEVSKGQSRTPTGPSEGILLWIEKVE
jgi:hypothetical protein